MTPFRVYNNPTKGFGLNFFGLEYIRKGFGDPPGASLSKFDLWGAQTPPPYTPPNQQGTVQTYSWDKSTQFALSFAPKIIQIFNKL